MRSRHVAMLVLLGLVALSQANSINIRAGFHEVCTEDNGPVTCAACARDSGSSSNRVSAYPRWGPDGQIHTSNLGFYNFSFLWTSTKDDNINFLDFQAILGAVQGTEELDPRNPLIYAIGLAIYPVLFIVLAILGFCMNWCFFCRCCCRGVPERRSCCEGCCGGHYPTYDGVAELHSRKCVWCCCNCLGFTYHHKDPKTGNQHNSPEDMYQYSFMQKCITRVYVLFSCINHALRYSK